jgi:ATP-dependent exoDNAse (exonuclease V) beta subunit
MPFTRRLPDGRVDSGAIDLLYRTDAGWHLVDFKTDELRDQAALEEALAKYRPQLTRYIRAMRELLGEDVQAWLCFLDYRGSLHRVRIEGEGI